MTQIGTLKELNVKPGDVVLRKAAEHYPNLEPWIIKRVTVGDVYAVKEHYKDSHTGTPLGLSYDDWMIISRVIDKPKTWGEMTDAEKGALLLAKHRDQTIECWYGSSGWEILPNPVWSCTDAYRIKPQPTVETITLHGSTGVTFTKGSPTPFDTHRITFTTTDGEPDCSSIKMERVDE